MNRSEAEVLVVVQARMSSSRLPGKVLCDLGGIPAIELQIRRIRRAGEPNGIVVATSTGSEDDAIESAVSVSGTTTVHRGPLADVLERFGEVLDEHRPDAVARVTADCPLLDPAVLDRVIARWRSGSAEYVANVFTPRTYPVGQDVEVVSTATLQAARREATEAYDREHVTPFVRDRPERFPAERVELVPGAGEVRVTLDTAADLETLRAVVARVGVNADLDEIVEAWRRVDGRR